MKNWIVNKIREFESISKMESFALKHYIYSTSFDNLINGKLDIKEEDLPLFCLL